MWTIVVGGLLTASSIKMEVFPEFQSDIITVSVPYLGAAPEEVEEGVCVRIEEALQDLEGIKKLSSTASEGQGSVTIEVQSGYDTRKLLDDVKSRVDAISTFPEETENPIVQEVVLRRQVINVAVSGDTDEASLKSIGENLREDLLATPGITQVSLASARPYEVSIEVSENDLRRYGLTFEEVVAAVRRSSLDLPGGSVKTSGGEILLRSKGQAYRGTEFESIVLRSRSDGTRLLLGDVANVNDGFAETDQLSRFDGNPMVLLQIFRVGDERVLDVAGAVKEYVAKTQSSLPEGIKLTTWQDQSRIFQDRLDLMLNNGSMGLVLVFLSLALFLRIKLAFWTALGIAIAFMGTIWLMPVTDMSVNMISLFAFIVVLGIVVDDAIVVGENIYVHQNRNKGNPLMASIAGVQEVSKPVIFAILTSVAAFSPLLVVEGMMGKFIGAIPTIVILMLLFSLVESLLILPAHLRHGQADSDEPSGNRPVLMMPIDWLGKGIRRVQDSMTALLGRVINDVYAPLLEVAIEWRYSTIAVGLSTMILTVGLVAGGWIKFDFFPPVPGDNVVVALTMPQGTPAEATSAVVRRIEDGALQLQKELKEEMVENSPDENPDIIRHIMASVGEQPFGQNQGPMGGGGAISASHLGEVNMELSPSESRSIGSTEIANRWREIVGPVADAVELSYSSSLFSSGEPINIQLASRHYDELQLAAAELKTRLTDYPGVYDITDSYRGGKQEVKLNVTPEAEGLGVSLVDLARQVRQAFYGEEAQRIQRGRDDIRVMVRYPEGERRSLGDLENMRIRLNNGAEVPFSVAAEAELGRGYASIRRVDRQRTISVTAEVDEAYNSNEILGNVEANYLPVLMSKYPGLNYTLEGEQRQQMESMGSLGVGFLFALLMIYVLLAIPFKSYLQPLIVMSAIPFGLIGAVWGHIVMGLNLTFLSMFGFVALAGVVVNDSLVLVDFINRGRESGEKLSVIIRTAGMSRFRPVILTSLTTFAGLTPILLERSLQAQFLIPMAISLGFGVLFATAITLILVPIGYITLEDATALAARITGRKPVVAPEIIESAEAPAG
jgi:multidrug efflux pump subunit AcrB